MIFLLLLMKPTFWKFVCIMTSNCQNTVLNNLKYADSHEWVKVDGKSATIGITDHAQDHLGDVVYVELPEVGTAVTQGDGFGAVESVKATSDINSPVSGKVIEVNEELSNSPALVSFIALLFIMNLYDRICVLRVCSFSTSLCTLHFGSLDLCNAEGSQCSFFICHFYVFLCFFV